MKRFFEDKINKGNPFMNNEEKEQQTEEIKDEAQSAEETQETEQTSDTVSDEINTEESEAEKLKSDLENLNNQYIRLAADFENYRKRQAQERESLLKYGAQECLKKVIEVADNFDRALQTVENIDNMDKMKETFYILNKQLTDSLTKLGLEQIKCVGEKFDPNLHEAVMQTPTEEYPEETIIAEMQKGYKMGDKVLRPAMVNVAVK